MRTRLYAYINPKRHGQYNRRQRKKYRIAEFQELSGKFDIQFVASLDEAKLDQFTTAFSEHVLVPHGLCFGGGFFEPPTLSMYVMTVGRGSVTQELCQLLLDWVRAYPDVAQADARLVDSWFEAVEPGAV